MGDLSYSASRFWPEGNVIVGNPMAYFNNTSQMYGGFYTQDSSALGDTVDMVFDLSPGDYRMTFFGARTTTSGIQDVFIDGVLVATFDHYFSPGTAFNVAGQANVTISTFQFTLRAVISGQNASSAGFNALLSRVFFNRI